MRLGHFVRIAVLTLGVASCSGIQIPKRGFVTHYFAGSTLQRSLQTSTDFVGRPLHPFIDSYAGTAADPSTEKNVATQIIHACTLSARQRASDVAFQGFGEATQKSVYDVTYSDCVTWHTHN